MPSIIQHLQPFMITCNGDVSIWVNNSQMAPPPQSKQHKFCSPLCATLYGRCYNLIRSKTSFILLKHYFKGKKRKLCVKNIREKKLILHYTCSYTVKIVYFLIPLFSLKNCYFVLPFNVMASMCQSILCLYYIFVHLPI